MNVEKIRIVVPETLLSVKYDEYEKDELGRIFYQWSDVIFLEEFFENNMADLSGDFYHVSSVEQAVMDTIQYATEFKERLRSHANGKNGGSLEALFRPYDNNSVEKVRERSKARGAEKDSWLRLYAIRLDENLYVITGGAIKLTHGMVREHLEVEHKKMIMVASYFKAEKIDSRREYGFIDFL